MVAPALAGLVPLITKVLASGGSLVARAGAGEAGKAILGSTVRNMAVQGAIGAGAEAVTGDPRKAPGAGVKAAAGAGIGGLAGAAESMMTGQALTKRVPGLSGAAAPSAKPRIPRPRFLDNPPAAPQAAPQAPRSFGSLMREKAGEAGRGILSRGKELKDALSIERIKQATFKGYHRPQPYGGTTEQRGAAMQAAGELLSGKDVAKRTGVKTPTLEQIVKESEAERQAKHDEARAKTTAAMGSTAKAALMMAVTPILAPILAAKFALGIKNFAEGIWESSRAISRYNASLAFMVALEERQKTLLAIRMGLATQGSATWAGGGVMLMRDEMQNWTQMGRSFGNLWAGYATRGITLLSFLVRHGFKTVQLLDGILRYWERMMGSGRTGVSFMDVMKDVGRRDWGGTVGDTTKPKVVGPALGPGPRKDWPV